MSTEALDNLAITAPWAFVVLGVFTIVWRQLGDALLARMKAQTKAFQLVPEAVDTFKGFVQTFGKSAMIGEMRLEQIASNTGDIAKNGTRGVPQEVIKPDMTPITAIHVYGEPDAAHKLGDRIRETAEAAAKAGLATLLCLSLTACAHFGTPWEEAQKALNHIDVDRVLTCTDLPQAQIAPCVGADLATSGISYLVERAGELIRSLISARSGGGAEADTLTEADIEPTLAELDAVLTLLRAEGVDLER